MLQRIESIENAAVWSGYDPKIIGTPDFKRYNLIYGWNASGKTTLSRVVALFGDNVVSRLPSDVQVHIIDGDKVLDSAKAEDRRHLPVRVFNRDFIDDNLQKTDYTQAPALFMVGQENIRLANRIESLNRRRERVAVMHRAIETEQGIARSILDNLATDLARECGSLLGIRDFRAPNIKTPAQDLLNPVEHMLDESELQAAVSQARDQSEFEPFRGFPAVTLPAPLDIDEIAELLRQTPQQNAIERLTDNPELSAWVRSGLRFHDHTTNCAFCGGDAAPALEEYAKHFSDEYQRQYAAIQALIKRLEDQPALPSFRHENDWVPSVRTKVKEVLERLYRWYAQDSEQRASSVALLRTKLTNMNTAVSVELPVEPLADLSVDLSAASVGQQSPALETILADLERGRIEHDRACDALAQTRKQAADTVKSHFVARFLLDLDANAASEVVSDAGKVSERALRASEKLGQQLAVAQAELQRSSVAVAKINELLARLLGSRISVEQAQDKRIRFIRDGKLAVNMSEGERTAISLAYFIVSLSQNEMQLDDAVVFIDDPICSLDANHIYDVAFLLITSLKVCQQLFISTHNSEFFNIIKHDWSDKPGRFKNDHAAFLIQREHDGKSQLLKLPDHLAKFRSDYHHVFYCLRKIQTSHSGDIEAYISCPNLLRRFLEMYLGFRRPTPESYVNKLDILFCNAAERLAVAKYVDEGSHSASTLRLFEFSDFPATSREMIGRVMQALQRVDRDHYVVLVKETEAG